MILGSVSENKSQENRVALTPDIIKKYISLGLEVNLIKDYATHMGISDELYKAEGAKFYLNEDEVLSNSNVVTQMSILSDDNLKKLKKNQILIDVLSRQNHI